MSKKKQQLSIEPTNTVHEVQLIKKEAFEKASKAADRVLRLYPSRVIKGQSFKGVKKHVVPNQSLTLKEILRRFVRKEPLAIGRDGIYNDSLGDLEKLANADITEQMETVDAIKAGIAKGEKEKRDREKQEADLKAKAEFDKAVQDAAAKLKQSDPGEPVKT